MDDEVFVARQPIFDREMKVTGYELLFRDAYANTVADVGRETATATVINNSFTEIGLKHIVGAREAWINVSPEFLDQGLEQLLPERAVLEVPYSADMSQEMLNAIGNARHRGAQVALDDFVYRPEADPLLRLVDAVKINVVELGREGVAEQIDALAEYSVKIVAMRVENERDHIYCLRSGCDLFQGYFFCRPEVLSGKRIDANRLAVLDLIAALHSSEAQLDDLQRRIGLDVGLSVRLLRYINSAFFGLRQPVRSIGQALALLGIERLKQWAALTLFASVPDKPMELTITALVRGRFCELAGAEAARTNGNGNELFTLGLFSVIDAVFDTPMEEALAGIPLANDLRIALTVHAGWMGQMLKSVMAIEAAEFDRAEELLPDAGRLYRSAVEWADEAAEPLFATD
jgi:c-di-GMP phosphodiesterase